ncbi:unnamed protein product, partial [Rotaria sp. Silwood1]
MTMLLGNLPFPHMPWQYT